MLFTNGISLLPVRPAGSNLVCTSFWTSTSKGTPYWRFILSDKANVSITPESVLPSFAIFMKISPGFPSSYKPVVTYPSCPATVNLWVTLFRSSGSFLRLGTSLMIIFSTIFLTSVPVPSVESLFVESGWLSLQPSRYSAFALRPNFQLKR